MFTIKCSIPKLLFLLWSWFPSNTFTMSWKRQFFLLRRLSFYETSALLNWVDRIHEISSYILVLVWVRRIEIRRDNNELIKNCIFTRPLVKINLEKKFLLYYYDYNFSKRDFYFTDREQKKTGRFSQQEKRNTIDDIDLNF